MSSASLVFARALPRVLDTLSHGLEHMARSSSDANRVVRFLRGYVAFEPRASDVFVATYPRSGTTWMQAIVYLITRNRGFDFEHISEVVPWWERSLALGTRRARDFEDIDPPRLFKTHLPKTWLPRGCRYIYIVRDAADVAVSYYHLYRSHLGFQGSFDAFFDRFVRGDLQYGAWVKHVCGWQAHQRDPNVLFLRYEAMRSQPRRAIEQVAEFLGTPLAARDVTRIAEWTSFASMKAHEAKFDHLGELRLQRGLHANAFIRRGRTGDGAQYLDPDQRARLAASIRRPPSLANVELALPRFLQ